jgi:hypothetical protein
MGTRIKFTWSTRMEVAWRLGLFAVHQTPPGSLASLAYLSGRRQKLFLQKTVFLCARGLLMWSGLLMIVAYFVGAWVILSVQARNLHNHITYADLVLPTRWSGLGTLRGKALVAQAEDEMKAGRLMEGFHLLKAGLTRNPQDVKARLDVSAFYIALRLRGHSDKVLMQAFDHGYPGRDYLVAAYHKLSQSDNAALLEKFFEAARVSHAQAKGTAEDERLIDKLLLDSRLKANRLADAGLLAKRVYPEGAKERSRIAIMAALEAGDLDEAIARLIAWESKCSSTEEFLAVAAGVYRRTGRFDDMQTAIDRLRELYPTNPAHVSLDVVQNLLAGRDAHALAALETGLIRFDSNAAALNEWARDISKVGRDDFLARIEPVMRDHGFGLQPILLARVLVQIKAGDWERARATSAELTAPAPRLLPATRASIRVITSLVTACVDAGSGTQQVFIEAFSRSPGTMELNRLLIDTLVANDRVATADELATLVEGLYPDSDYMRDVSARIDTRLRSLAQAEQDARSDTKESPAAAFPDGPAFLKTVERMQGQGEWGEALRLIRAVRLAAPGWLGDVNDRLFQHELNLAVKTNDLPLLQLTVRTYLRGNEARYQAALDLAARWHGEGRKNESLLTAREILKLKPDFSPALEALAVWDPKPRIDPDANGVVPDGS